MYWLRHQPTPRRPSRGRAAITATILLLSAALLSGCGLFESNPAPSGTGYVTGGGFATTSDHPTGGGFAGSGNGSTAQIPPANPTPGAPGGEIGAVPVPSATPAPSGGVASVPALPASIAFAVPQANVQQIAGRLAYVGADNRIWTMQPDGTDWRTLIDEPTGDEPPGSRVVNLNVAPSGKALLYTVINADGSAPRSYMLDLVSGQVTHQKYNGAWSTDNVHVATTGGDTLIVYNTSTGAEENLGAGSSPAWTADNNLLAFRSGNVWQVAYPPNPAADRALTSFPADGADAWQFYQTPLYHYSGRVIFAGAPRSALDANGNGVRIMAVDPDGTLGTLVGAGGSNVRYMQLSPSGTRLAYSMQTTRNGCVSYGGLQFANASGGGDATAPIPQDDTSFAFMRGIAWSPDQKLVYAYTERSCASGSPVDTTGDRLFLIDPAAPATARYIGDGAFPAFIRVWALGSGGLQLR